MCPTPRTAILNSHLRDTSELAGFQPGDRLGLACWNPAVVAGSLRDLLAMEFSPPYAVIAFTRPGSPLAHRDRDRLWRRFEVPIFEQMIDSAGRVVAWECEGHEGLHLLCPAAKAPAGEIRDGLCACGKRVRRLFPAANQRTLTVTRSESVCPPDPVATT
jgi:hypothetical protein